jgi:micrococcal nuclease
MVPLSIENERRMLHICTLRAGFDRLGFAVIMFPMYNARSMYICILALFIFCARTERVTEVIDGDTFKTETGATVRLLGINAPEMNNAGGDIAKNMLACLLRGDRVRLQRDITDKDDYGRLLRYVFASGKLVNAELVRMGCAEVRFYPPDTLYAAEMRELEKTAIRNRRGLWAFPVFQVSDTTDTTAVRVAGSLDTAGMISWRDAAEYYGQTMTVEGKIVVTNNTGRVCFLNFHEDWRRYFTAVIFASDFDKFPAHPEDHYLNHVVRVRGLIKEYRDKPEIILKSPVQIEIVR